MYEFMKNKVEKAVNDICGSNNDTPRNLKYRFGWDMVSFVVLPQKEKRVICVYYNDKCVFSTTKWFGEIEFNIFLDDGGNAFDALKGKDMASTCSEFIEEVVNDIRRRKAMDIVRTLDAGTKFASNNLISCMVKYLSENNDKYNAEITHLIIHKIGVPISMDIVLEKSIVIQAYKFHNGEIGLSISCGDYSYTIDSSTIDDGLAHFVETLTDNKYDLGKLTTSFICDLLLWVLSHKNKIDVTDEKKTEEKVMNDETVAKITYRKNGEYHTKDVEFSRETAIDFMASNEIDSGRYEVVDSNNDMFLIKRESSVYTTFNIYVNEVEVTAFNTLDLNLANTINNINTKTSLVPDIYDKFIIDIISRYSDRAKMLKIAKRFAENYFYGTGVDPRNMILRETIHLLKTDNPKNRVDEDDARTANVVSKVSIVDNTDKHGNTLSPEYRKFLQEKLSSKQILHKDKEDAKDERKELTDTENGMLSRSFALDGTDPDHPVTVGKHIGDNHVVVTRENISGRQKFTVAINDELEGIVSEPDVLYRNRELALDFLDGFPKAVYNFVNDILTEYASHKLRQPIEVCFTAHMDDSYAKYVSKGTAEFLLKNKAISNIKIRGTVAESVKLQRDGTDLKIDWRDHKFIIKNWISNTHAIDNLISEIGMNDCVRIVKEVTKEYKKLKVAQRANKNKDKYHVRETALKDRKALTDGIGMNAVYKVIDGIRVSICPSDSEDQMYLICIDNVLFTIISFDELIGTGISKERLNCIKNEAVRDYLRFLSK